MFMSSSRVEQGKLLTWNPDTFESTVLWRGAVLTNLPVLAGPAALSFAPGQQVAVVGGSPGGGAGSWAILGQWITPGTTAAEQAIDFMKGELGRAVAADVAAARVHTDRDDAQATVQPTGIKDPDIGNPGPSVTFTVFDSGKALVELGTQIIPDTVGTGQNEGRMYVEITGATTVSPSVPRSVGLREDGLWAFSASRRIELDLNPGEHVATAKYSATGVDMLFTNRTVVVEAF